MPFNLKVVLNEHFRCAPEIINFCNKSFYNEELVPMRLPTKTERITPSIVDIRVPNGRKNGKSNVEEAKAIIKFVEGITSKISDESTRSIGIISLMGSEQSQVIRSGLLEVIGPHLMAKHDILVGDPPTFQGTERDSKFSRVEEDKNISSHTHQLSNMLSIFKN
jgi:superfamily I DNA and/or RNA helicase